jgi:hypothetical protein
MRNNNNSNNKLTTLAYMLKRLRDNGYRADRLVGNNDVSSMKKRLSSLVKEKFGNGSANAEQILEFIESNRAELGNLTKYTSNYSQADSRTWTIIIDAGVSSVFLTCYRNLNGLDDDYFELFDGQQFVTPIRYKIKTDSFEVLLTTLNELCIINKVNTPTKKPVVIYDEEDIEEIDDTDALLDEIRIGHIDGLLAD